ncbi:TonB-dependent receptor [Sphingomonas sp.]|uniref:TonB-dependent receptor n=1 Tax=Sphingomonas sp. TaxID=28214 RepID=UPI002D1CF374|nr:TonB-dependent receptor [Sphingomonas sp.]HWK35539.1 TonB-dependent receptor [Sphingomonas sp.]
MPTSLLGATLPALALLSPVPVEDDPQRPDIVVTAGREAEGTRASIDAETIAAKINAINVEDTIKYLPSLIVRKRHIGDTQAPIATRTSGLGASARSLIYADGVLLSALIGNNNTSASPRWGMVSPEEISRIDVSYGPYAAARPGNSIGAVVEITTRLPDRLEATAHGAINVQNYEKYGTDETLPSRQFSATIGDRFGSLTLFASLDHVDSQGQPLGYVTAAAGTGSTGMAATGGFADRNRTGGAIRVLGATGLEHQRQDRYKLKAALDLTPGVTLTYVGALFLNTTDARSETYLSDAAGAPAYAGTFLIDGRPYTVAASAFSNGTYRSDTRHWSHSLSAGGQGGPVAWQVIGSSYAFDRDEQRIPGTALPGAAAGGAGTITRLNGTGWRTLDASASWRGLSVGGHWDAFRLASDRFATRDWRYGDAGEVNLASRGKTRTIALWAQQVVRPIPALSVTIGGRHEWWKAFDGRNFSLSPAIAAQQPELSAARFSPKASLAWDIGDRWTVRGSYGRAWRFPTVSELYQLVTTPVPAVPDPNLRPERADSQELALERRDGRGTMRLALFNEVVADALVGQSGPLNGTTTIATFVQNVERTRARGVELSFDRRDLVPRFDLAGSVTYADAVTSANAAAPASVGKLIPGVPHWKASLVATWRPDDAVSLTAAGRYTSRIFGTLDNSDAVGDTYQGFDRYLVVDLRAAFRVGRRWSLGLGVDNLTNDRYFLFHPFPQRSITADATLKL